MANASAHSVPGEGAAAPLLSPWLSVLQIQRQAGKRAVAHQQAGLEGPDEGNGRGSRGPRAGEPGPARATSRYPDKDRFAGLQRQRGARWRAASQTATFGRSEALQTTRHEHGPRDFAGAARPDQGTRGPQEAIPSEQATEDIRTHTAALNAVKFVSENEPYRNHLLKAQLLAFMKRTMGMRSQAVRGQDFSTTNLLSVPSLEAHLNHGTPAFFRMPGNLYPTGSMAPSSSGQEPDPSLVAAAATLIHARRMLDHCRYGEDGPGNRRILKRSKARSWRPVPRYRRNLRRLFETRGSSLTLAPGATALIPRFQQGSEPFFSNSPEDIHAGHEVMIRHNQYCDFGPRNCAGKDSKEQFR